MRRTDDVFFFTLVDFLVQVLFFGLVVYVLGQASQSEASKSQEREADQVQKLRVATGVSDLTELTDILTRLAPLKDVADVIKRLGGLELAKRMAEVVAKHGGVEAFLRKYDGSGKPPCLSDIVGERRVPRPLATVLATDSTIRFEANTPDLEETLRLLGRSFEFVKELPLAEFKGTFSPLVEEKPDCRYTLRFLESTRFVDARDAARVTFYLNIVKR